MEYLIESHLSSQVVSSTLPHECPWRPNLLHDVLQYTLCDMRLTSAQTWLVRLKYLEHTVEHFTEYRVDSEVVSSFLPQLNACVSTEILDLLHVFLVKGFFLVSHEIGATREVASSAVTYGENTAAIEMLSV